MGRVEERIVKSRERRDSIRPTIMARNFLDFFWNTGIFLQYMKIAGFSALIGAVLIPFFCWLGFISPP